jgi:hypothetical protein
MRACGPHDVLHSPPCEAERFDVEGQKTEVVVVQAVAARWARTAVAEVGTPSSSSSRLAGTSNSAQ